MKRKKMKNRQGLRRKMNKFSLFLFLFICSGVLFLPAESFTFSGDSMNTIIAKGKERTLLEGNASITSESTHIEAETIELYGKDSRFAFCSGNVRVVDKEKGILLTSDHLYYDREEDISRVDGYAEMEDQKNELIVKGGYLENFGNQDVTIIQIGVRILKEDLACRSEFARYRRDEEILELSGMPFVHWKGDEYRASRITINLDTDEILLEGEVEGTVVAEDDEAAEEESPAEDNQPEQAGESAETEPDMGSGSSEEME